MNFMTVATIFLNPMNIQNNALALLWIIPLVVAISVVYKATKVSDVGTLRFAKECCTLVATILMFMALIAVALYVIVAVTT